MADAAKAHGVVTVHCKNAEEVLQYLRQFVRPGDAVLAKASHAMGLEQLLQDFYKELPQGQRASTFGESCPRSGLMRGWSAHSCL